MQQKMINKQKIVEYMECPSCGYTEEINHYYNVFCPRCGEKICKTCGLPNQICVCKEIKTIKRWQGLDKMERWK